MRVVFMGTSEFAVPALKQIHYSIHEIIAIITQPDRPKGRGQKLSQSPIKKTAKELNYKVLQPKTVNDNNFISSIKALAPDLYVILAFGQILCKEILEIPKKGAINVHPSLIPKYRGAAPIQWAIINGDKKTGVTTMLMDEGMDTGPILIRRSTNIRSYESLSCLHDRLSVMGSKLILETIDKIQHNLLIPIPQKYKKAPTRMFKKNDGKINWNNSAEKIESFIRGMNPWPGTFTFYNGNRIKIISASILKLNFKELPGTILKYKTKTLCIATKKNAISVETIQVGSGKKLPINAFLCGFNMQIGTTFN